jgi:hypothetical protein
VAGFGDQDVVEAFASEGADPVASIAGEAATPAAAYLVIDEYEQELTIGYQTTEVSVARRMNTPGRVRADKHVRAGQHARSAKLVFRSRVVIDAQGSGIHRLPGPRPGHGGRSRERGRDV